MNPFRTQGLALSCSLDEAIALCERQLAGDPTLQGVNVLNLGFASATHIPDALPGLLAETGWRTVIHCIDLNLSTTVSADAVRALRRAAERLDVMWFEEDLGVWLWDGMFLASHLLNPVQNHETACNTARNVRGCSGLLEQPFLIENPPAYYVEGDLDMWEYLGLIAEEADCGIVLDIGHMIGYLMNTGREVCIAPPTWRGWRRVREIHLSGFESYRIRGVDMWIDRHSLPFDSRLLEWAGAALAYASEPCLVTLELEGAPPEVVAANLDATRVLMGVSQ